MPTFRYIARNAEGARVSGEAAGASASAVVSDLRSRSLVPVRVEARREPIRQAGRGRVSARALGLFYRQLSDLLRAGVPILRALRLLGRMRSTPRLSAVVTQVAQDVEDGEALADAFSKHPAIFPTVQVAMVRAGEKGGFLEEVLRRISDFLRQQAELRSQVLATLIYPAVLLGLGSLIVGVVMVVFVPKFEPMFEGLELPFPTVVVMTVSDLLINRGVAVLVGLIAAVVVLRWVASLPSVRLALAKWSLRVWVIGPLLASIAVARFSRLLGTLLANGIPMLSALQISKEAAGNVLLTEAVDSAQKSVESGRSLSGPLGESGLFDEDVIEIIKIGESANNLDEVLITLADTLDARVGRILNTSVRLLEPLVLVILGVSLLFIIMALVIPLVMLTRTL